LRSCSVGSPFSKWRSRVRLIYTAPTPALLCLAFEDSDLAGLLLFTPADTELLANGSVPPSSIAIFTYVGRQ
jgi:hypothetical protein